jgi:hypothetical protein
MELPAEVIAICATSRAVLDWANDGVCSWRNLSCPAARQDRYIHGAGQGTGTLMVVWYGTLTQ